jgi:hypothetical protein
MCPQKKKKRKEPRIMAIRGAYAYAYMASPANLHTPTLISEM